MGETGFRVLLVTVPDPATGVTLAEALVGEQLAACVNRVDGIHSTYRWQGKVERGAESLLIIKTRASLVPGVIAKVRALHPYTVPEVVSLAVDDGNPAYLEWLAAETDATEFPAR